MMTTRTIGCTSLVALLAIASCGQEAEQASTQGSSGDESLPSPFDVAPLGTLPSGGGAHPPRPTVDLEQADTIAAEGSFRAAGLTFSVPEGWVPQTPSSSMRAAQFAMPSGEEGVDDAILAVFASIGGTVEQNITRWIDQVSNPENPAARDTREVGSLTVHTVVVTGTFSAGMMSGGGAPAPGTTLLGAVITGGPGGPVFLKATGPKEAIENNFGAWEALISSAGAG